MKCNENYNKMFINNITRANFKFIKQNILYLMRTYVYLSFHNNEANKKSFTVI